MLVQWFLCWFSGCCVGSVTVVGRVQWGGFSAGSGEGSVPVVGRVQWR